MPAEFLQLSLELITANREQPRTEFEPEAIGVLAANIAAVGLLQPVSVRAIEDGRFELVHGERRFRACELLDWPTIPAIIRQEELDDEAMLTAALTENMMRVDMNVIEEASGIARLCELGQTHQQIARLLGVSVPTIVSRLAWLELEPEIQNLVAQGRLPSGRKVSKALASVDAGAGRVALAMQLADKGQSVQSIERAAEIYRSLEAGESDSKTHRIGDDGRLLRTYHKEKRAADRRRRGRTAVHAFTLAGGGEEGEKIDPEKCAVKAIAYVCKTCFLHDFEAGLPCQDCPLTALVKELV
jgi:ParB family chromosome partitioning protein